MEMFSLELPAASLCDRSRSVLWLNSFLMPRALAVSKAAVYSCSYRETAEEKEMRD